MKLKDPRKLIIAIGISLLPGIIGSLFTAPAISGWYAELIKPAINPPSWVFGPMWTILYILMGIAAYLVWRSYAEQNDPNEKRKRRNALIIFDIQLILNAAWSIIFFGLELPGTAFVEIVLLWIAILATIYVFYPISRRAAYLLIPYIAWVSFAAYLNYSLWMLN